MATDATGTPSSPDGIPTYNTAVDSPSGKGFNAMVAAVQAALSARIGKTLVTTTGDIIYASSANTPARLGIGSTGQVLKVVGGVPAWGSAGVTTTTSAISGGPPGSPADGDIWIATAAGSNGERWAFQYNAGSGSAYKWEFIGGSPVIVQDANSQTLSVSGAYTPLTSMQLTVPRAGDYEIVGDLVGSGSTAGAATVILSVSQNSTSVSTYVIGQTIPAGASFPYFISGKYKATAVAASDVFRLLYNQNGTNPTSVNRQMSILPIRIS